MFGIDQEVQKKADAYRGNPQMLQQKYAQNQQLIDLLALQKLKSDKEEASREIALKMNGKPQTIADQREAEAMDNARKDVMQEQGGVEQNKMQQMQAAQKSVMQAAGAPPGVPPQGMPSPSQSQGLAGLPAPNIQGMAEGGIVAFDDGGSTMKAGLERLLETDPEAMYEQRKAEAATETNYTPEERAAKQRHIDEAAALSQRQALGRALSAGAGYTNPYSAIANMGLTAASNEEAAMKARHAGEGQLIDIGPAARAAGLKAGESAYQHGITGLYRGVASAAELQKARELAASRGDAAEARRLEKELAATLRQEGLDEKIRNNVTNNIRNDRYISSWIKQLETMEASSPEAAKINDAIFKRENQLLVEGGLSPRSAPQAVEKAPVVEKPSRLDAVMNAIGLGAGKKATPSAVPFSSLQP